MPSKNIPRYFFVRSVEIDWFRFTTIISINVPFILLFALSFFSAACVFFVILFCFFSVNSMNETILFYMQSSSLADALRKSESYGATKN